MEKMRIKRLLTICLALMLSVSMLPAGVFAAGDPGQGAAPVTDVGGNDSTNSSENGTNDSTGAENSNEEVGTTVNENDNNAVGQDNEQPVDEQKIDGEPVPAADGGSSDALPAAASTGPAKAPEGADDPTAPDDDTAGEEHAVSLNVTVDGNDVTTTDISRLADKQVDFTITATLPQTSGTKSLTVNIPTGWIIIGYSALDEHDDHTVTIPQNAYTAGGGGDLTAGKHIDVDGAYKDALKKVTLDPDTGESAYGYGTVVSPDNKWEVQYLSGWTSGIPGSDSILRTYGGKLTYDLSEDASNVKIVVKLLPQPYLFPRSSSSEEMPKVTVTVSSQHTGEDPVVETVETKKVTATNLAKPVISGGASYNMQVPIENSKTDRFSISGAINQYNTNTGHRTSRSLADELTYTLEYPPGVFLSENQTNRVIWGTIIDQDEDPVNGGGYITMRKTKAILSHVGGTTFRFYFEARAGNGQEFHPDCPTVYGNDDTRSFDIIGRGTVTRGGEVYTFPEAVYTRNIYLVDEGNSISIHIGTDGHTRRDLAKDYGLEDYDILLANTSLKPLFARSSVPFHYVNRNNKLGITGFHTPGKNVKDIVVKTFHADGSPGRTIVPDPATYPTPNNPVNYSSSHRFDAPFLGLEEGEYISEVYLKVDVQQLECPNDFLGSGIGFIGQFLPKSYDENQLSYVDVSVVKLDGEGNYTDEVVLDAYEKDEDGNPLPIKGWARVKIGQSSVGSGTAFTNVWNYEAGSDSNHNDIWYPNDEMHFYSVISTSSTVHGQDTLVDPTITISLPAGVQLTTTSVMAQSYAGNHKDGSWFTLEPTATRKRTINNVEWTCYDYTSSQLRDMVANEKSTNAKAGKTADQEFYYGGTVTSREQQIKLKFTASVTSTCPQYSLNTQNLVMWNIGGGRGLVNGTTGEDYRITDTYDRMGMGTNKMAVAGKHQLTIKPLVGLSTDLAIRAMDPESNWMTWVGDEDTVAAVHEGKTAEVKLSYKSTSESEDFKDTILYLPIPKEGKQYKYVNNIVTSGPADAEKEGKPETYKAFEFTASLDGPVEMIGEETEWETLYGIEVDSNTVMYDELEDPQDKESWEPVVPSSGTKWYTAEEIQADDKWDQVTMLKFVAKQDILPGKSGEATITLNVDPEAEFGSYDHWRAYGRAKLGLGANQWKYTPIIAATPSSATFSGQIFIDDNVNAAFDNTGDTPELGYGTNFSAEMKWKRDDLMTPPKPVTIDIADGSMSLLDMDGKEIYLHKGEYTLTVTRSDAETTYDYERIESGTPSSESKWYNDIKNINVNDAVATHTITVDNSLIKTRAKAKTKGTKAESNCKPAVYYVGVGLAKMNDISFTKLGEVEVEGAEGNATNEPLEGAKFALYTDKNCTIPALRDGTEYKATSDADGKVEFNDIVAGTYYMKETALPSGTDDLYFLNTNTYKVVVDNEENVEISVEGTANPNTGDITGSQEDGYSINNRQKTSITGIKIWRHDSTDDPSPITVNIIAEGATVASKTVEVIFEGEPGEGQVLATETADGWTFTVDGLNKFKDGAEVTYSIAEEALAGYLTSQEGNTITNIKKTESTVKKVWNDGNNTAGKRPGSLEFSLYQKVGSGTEKAVTDSGGNAVTRELPINGKWEATVKDLPKYDKDGNEITYSWKEPETINNYKLTKTDVEDNTTTFTNTLLKEVSVEKAWVAPQTKVNPDKVTVNLLKGETKIDSAELSASNSWKHTFTSSSDYVLYAYDEQGKAITYSITEEPVAGYDVNITGPTTVSGNDSFAVTNTYDAKGSITFSGTKSISRGREIKEGEIFKFTVKEGEKVVVKGTSDADGKITFDPINYVYNKDKDDTGEHTYTVTEEAYDKDGVKRSSKIYTIHVNVTDNLDGTLAATPTEDVTKLDFENPYDSKGQITVDAEKTLENREFKEGDEWTFTIAGEDGAPLPVNEAGEEISSVTIKPTEGNTAAIDFGTFKYEFSDLGENAKAGDSKTFTYTITESGEIAGVKNDPDTDRTLKIKVTDQENGELKAELAEDSEEVKFTNTYETAGEITFSGKKTLQGKALSEGEFIFELYDKDGKLIESVTNKADGSYSFSELNFTGNDLDRDEDGNYIETTKTYRVVENQGTDSHITYDKTEYVITATLTDDGNGNIEVSADPAEDSYNFTNTYTPDKPVDPGKPDKPVKETKVKTGDDTNIGLWIALLLMAVCGFAGTLVYRRRKND